MNKLKLLFSKKNRIIMFIISTIISTGIGCFWWQIRQFNRSREFLVLVMSDILEAEKKLNIQNMLQRILILFVLITLLLFVSLFIKKRKKVQ